MYVNLWNLSWRTFVSNYLNEALPVAVDPTGTSFRRNSSPFFCSHSQASPWAWGQGSDLATFLLVEFLWCFSTCCITQHLQSFSWCTDIPTLSWRIFLPLRNSFLLTDCMLVILVQQRRPKCFLQYIPKYSLFHQCTKYCARTIVECQCALQQSQVCSNDQALLFMCSCRLHGVLPDILLVQCFLYWLILVCVALSSFFLSKLKKLTVWKDSGWTPWWR